MASSGTIYTGYQNYTRFYLTWRLVQQDVANNRSLISWEIGVQGTAGRTAYWYSNAIKVNSGYLNGSLVSGAGTYSNITLEGAESKGLRGGSIWVGHNADGSKSFSATVSGWLYGYGNLTAGGSWGLPTIPRNSQVSMNGGANYTLGDPLTITTNRKSTSFSHTITIRLNNSSGTVLQTFNSVGSSVVWTPTEGQITTMQNAIPTSNRLTLYINQYNNQVAANSNVSLYTYLSDANPTFDDFTYKDTNTTTVTVTGNDQVLVKGKSTLQVKVPSAEKMVAIKGADEDLYSVSYEGVSNQVAYSTGDVTTSFSDVNAIGNRTILVTAYDSRSNTTQVSKNVTVYDYAEPTIVTTLTRENNFGTDTTIHIEGTYTPLVIGGVNKNSLTTSTLQYRYKEDGGSFGSWVTKTFTVNTTAGTFSVTDFVVALDNSKKYLFEFHITDKFGTVTTTATVDIGTPIMFIGQNSGVAAIGINKMPEEGALDVDGDIYMNGEKVATVTPPATPVAFSVYNSVTQTSGNNAFAALSFNTEEYDLSGNFASNVFTAPVSGLYTFSARIHTVSANTRFLVSLYTDTGSGYSEKKRGVDHAGTGGTAGQGAMVSADIQLSAGDKVRPYSFGNAALTVANGAAECYFQGRLLYET